MKIDKKKIIIFFIILISFLIILLFGKSSNASEDNIVETTEETVEVSNQTIITTLTAPGEVQSAKTEKISLNTNYYYLTMCAEENEYIKKGDNLLEYTNGTYITAPYDCIITEYSVPNAKDICTSDNYIQISSVEDLYMEINIGEDKIGKISSGQEVSIVVNYDETKEYTGNISKINAIGTHNTGGSTFTAIASIKNDGKLALTTLGGPLLNTLNGEYCRIYTRNQKVYTGTIISTSSSSHVYPDAANKEMTIDNLEVQEFPKERYVIINHY